MREPLGPETVTTFLDASLKDRPGRERRRGRSASLRASAALGFLALALAACSGRPREVVYDLAGRAPVAERRTPADVLLFGTPAAEPRLAGGFRLEVPGGDEPFLRSAGEPEVLFQWAVPEARVAILDAAPAPDRSPPLVQVRLNGTDVERFRMDAARHRYRIALPASAQRTGENRLRLVFAPASAGESPAAAAPVTLFSLVVGPASDTSIDDLLARDAPHPFAVDRVGGVPRLHLCGPASVRFTVRLPENAELRFTPALDPAARLAASAVSFRVLLETEAGDERELWSRVLDYRAQPSLPEQVVALAGTPGAIVRVGLAVEPAGNPRFAWGHYLAPRILGRGRRGLLDLRPRTAEDDARADDLRRALGGFNVVLVILDAARASEFGTYGYGRRTTPQIDRIAAEGVVFERAYTTAVYTLAAMSSLWTSQYPDRHPGDMGFAARLPGDRLTLAEVLSGEGIHTMGFTANGMSSSHWGLAQGFDEFHEVYRNLGVRARAFRRAVPPRLADSRDRRFFAYIHFVEPHAPYDPPPPFDTLFGPEGPIPKGQRDRKHFKDVNQGQRRLSAAEREHLVRLYDGNLAYVDQEVGALRESLEAQGLWERTVLIVAADHGDELYEHGVVGHSVHVFEPTAHIPLVMRFPRGSGPSGVRVGELVDLVDLAPTIADVFGVRGRGGSDRTFQGQSLLPVIAGAPGRTAVLTRTVWDQPRYGLREGAFTYILDTRSGEEELYDRSVDPAESRDVAAEHPLRASYYRQALWEWIRQRGPAVAAATEAAPLSPEECENLKVLGYVEACP